MLHMMKLNLENVWKIVRKTRLSFLSRHIEIDSVCNEEKTLLSNGNIQENMNSLFEELKLNPTSTPDTNIPSQTLQTAGQMFTYLNYCPTAIPKHLLLRAYLFQTATPKEIILALISIIKTSQNLTEKKETIEMLSKLMEILHLKQYENVQIITKDKCYTNAIFDKCPQKIDINENKTMKLLG